MGLDLVTLAEYKSYKGITSVVPADDTIATKIITRVSALAKSICRRTFVDYVNDAKVETHSGGNDRIYMLESPLLAFGGLELSTNYGASYTDLVEFTDYAVDNEDGSIVAIGEDAIFPKYVNGYRITYNCGYETLPEDLKLAVLDLVHYYVKNDMSVHSPKAPGTNTVQIEYITTTSLPAHIRRVFDLYTESYA